MQEVRRPLVADFQPILVMALIPEDELEDEDPQVSNIEEMCKSHYGLTPKSVRKQTRHYDLY